MVPIRYIVIFFLGFLCSFEASASYTRGVPVAADSLILTDSSEVVLDSLVTYARTYLGTPYKYGGRGPERFDCSGYTSHVFTSVDVRLPFSSRAQIAHGMPVALDSVRKGDLLFFTSPRSGSNPGHVGIVTRVEQGKLYFIHSSSTRGVVEDPLKDHYRRRFIEARRILN